MNRYALPALALATLLTAHAQQTPNMPGMPMPSAPTPLRAPPKSLQTPADMKSIPGENPHAKAADASVQASEAQQRANAGSKPTDTQSLHHGTYTEQEFEAPDIHSGADLPAPVLLGDTAQRPAVTLQTIEAWADAANPTLAQARALVKRSEAQARQAGLPPDPIVGYSGEHLRGGSYGGGENGAFAEQTFVLGGKLALRKGIYAAQAGADRIEVEAQTSRVQNDVERTFYEALTAQAEVDIHRKLVALAEAAARTAHEFANLGQQDAPEVLDAEVEAEQAKIDYMQAERLYLARFVSLVSSAGHPGEPLSRLQGELENPPQLNPGTTVADIIHDSPTVRQAQQEVSVAETRLRDAHRESVPNLRVQAGAWYSGEQLNGTARPAGWMGFAQAGVQLPLWNRNQGNIAAAQAELDRTQAEVARTQLVLQQRAEPLAQRYLAARFQAERYRDQLLPRAQRAHDLYVLKYQQMAAAYPQVLISERTLLRLRLAYLESLNEEWSAAIALRNNTLEGGLEAPTSQSTADTTLNLPTGGSD